MIKKNQSYAIRGSSKYFLKKYGTYNPTIIIEDKDSVIFGGSWMNQNGNPTCLLYAARSGIEGLPLSGNVYYGKIEGLGELVHESELLEVK